MYLPYIQKQNYKFQIGEQVRFVVTGEVYRIIGLPGKRSRYYKAVRLNTDTSKYQLFMEDELEQMQDIS